ncbi:sugar 3,4-ketoisomerase [Actinomadura rugatobispora]|uniref:FdtA/QdtA family cupin domain-containing protein n=1 Tax=Actinomadura rugatobispora TaxID=1994 RepID=A0ABW1AHA3_9ACTN|nr:FdtA/QdtA family cupin domain-containing protein [Actinomadura rugatobispora]
MIAPQIIKLEEHRDEVGCIFVVETSQHIPFEVKRYYSISDVPDGADRGSHAHRRLEQLVIAAYGSFDITLDDGFERRRHRLSDPGVGLYIGPMIWRDLTNFSSGAVAVVLASRHYEESDYYRDYDEFLRDAARAGRGPLSGDGTPGEDR